MGALLYRRGHHTQIQQVLIHDQTEPRRQPVTAHIPLLTIVRVLLLTTTSLSRDSFRQVAAVQRTQTISC